MNIITNPVYSWHQANIYNILDNSTIYTDVTIGIGIVFCFIVFVFLNSRKK